MRTILFVTGNKGKAASLQQLMPNGFVVEQVALDVPELQLDSVEEIVREKARYAFEKLQKPLVMQDSSFHIPALNGFPGPYVKHVTDMIGAEGILKLMDGVADRRAYFLQAIGYADENGTVHTFVCDEDCITGTIPLHIGAKPQGHAWGAIWRVYQPEWSDVPLSEISPETLAAHTDLKKSGSEFAKFIQFLTKNS